MNLRSPISEIKGAGNAIVHKLGLLGVETVTDLLYFLPRRYEDFSHIIPIAAIQPGNVTIKARIESVSGKYARRGLHITEAVLADETAKTRAVWFNQPYRSQQCKVGDIFYFSGSYELQRSRYTLSNPAVEREQDFTVSTGRILPIYHETKGLKSIQVRRLVRELIPLMKLLPETLPEELIRQEQLLAIGDALFGLHFPDTIEQLERSKARVAFEELLSVLLASLMNKRANNSLEGYRIPFNRELAQTFVGQLRFIMTDAQRRSAWEILQDFEQGVPMNRLLQGDVGSGKTVVAAMAAFMAVRAGYQVAVMAPTEILAAQHAETLAKLLEPLKIRIGLLTGSLKAPARQLLQDSIADGRVDIIVGTHALIQKDSHYKRLGFVVIDEQHRFGVEQRNRLLGKSERMPHLLSMTATPIPRSLQLTVYGELEVSVIDELPPGRHPIITELFSPYARKQVYTKIEKELEEGRQAYVVCPLIDDSPQAEFKSVEAVYAQLKESLFAHRRLGMLHGQMKPEEKDSVMESFKNGTVDILVATSVIEVGVDVPNATVMLIEGAERFGLAQLHQLRGRVGRGAHQSYCFLVPSSGKRPSQRLRELEQSQDGFYLAEVDLRLRGPGEIYGRQQHGALDLKVANLSDTKLIKHVRSVAEKLLEMRLNLLQYEQLNERVSRYRRLTTLN